MTGNVHDSMMNVLQEYCLRYGSKPAPGHSFMINTHHLFEMLRKKYPDIQVYLTKNVAFDFQGYPVHHNRFIPLGKVIFKFDMDVETLEEYYRHMETAQIADIEIEL